MKSSKEKTDDLTTEEDWQEQYFRRNRLLIHGITENKNENTNACSSLESFWQKDGNKNYRK